ncbi:galectin-16-like [Pongo pygmaeus]|uniref:galectin-16-like n=1 Tax=Pongo pygmaeus TaxID=9600 RepID=UPI0023E18C63|nr:galectin-16-like [Pongo pygmaeus]
MDPEPLLSGTTHMACVLVYWFLCDNHRDTDDPFRDGKPFNLCISVLANEYQVTVNGQHAYSFTHRLPPSYVKMVQVWRDVSMTSVSVCN